MANVRIKDITTTASAPAADDYLAIDGATAGTRKISAANLGGDTLTTDIKDALLQIASKVAYIDDQGQTYYDDLYDALYPPAPPATLLSISAVYTQSGTVYNTDTLDSLKPDLVVTASYDDGTTQTVTTYTLSGTLAVGTSTITVTYGGKTTTFDVTVTEAQRLPEGYTEYDYIKWDSSATPTGIVTNIQLSSDHTIETSFGYDASNNYACCLFGTRNGNNGTKCIALYITPSSGKVGYWYDGIDTSTTITGARSGGNKNTVVIKPIGKSDLYPASPTLTLNGIEYSMGTVASPSTWPSWFGVLRYAISASGTGGTAQPADLRVGEIKVTSSSGSLVHDLIPCYTGTKYGFYETRTEQTWTWDENVTGGNWEE